eukprot:UN04003
MSRMLRELVELFGASRIGERDGDGKLRKVLFGPFYCGMSVVLSLPEFHIRLNGPTSTSVHIEVALRFAGKLGIIIEFDNPIKSQYENLRGFNCSSFSCFSEEDERLFFGGYQHIKITAIRIIQTRQNFRDIIHSLQILDSVISGSTIT